MRVRNSIYAQTQTKDNYKKDKRITPKQWKVYYYLLGISKFNSQQVEDHRYIYRKDLNISQACRDLGIKSTQTFYNAIEKLQDRKLIRKTEQYYLIYAQNWISVDKNVLTNLVKFAKTREKDIDLLRTFLILKKMDKIADSSAEKSFTLRQICVLLGHGDTNADYYASIRFYLALLCFWGLIELTQHKQYCDGFGAYTVYHLQAVKETDLNADFESDIKGEMNAPLPSTELMNKLKFVIPEMIE